jgi:hypothetical protein
MAITIGLNEFVLRQTPESKFSHFEGTWEELVALVTANFHNARPGYRDGVKLVDVDSTRFRSSIVKIGEDTPLQATFGHRREGEQSHTGIVAKGMPKGPAENVFIVLYHRDVLLEDDVDRENVGPETWQILSINASPSKEEVPFQPLAWARNVANLEGGTDPELESKSKEELIELIRENANAYIWWTQHTMVEPLKADEIEVTAGDDERVIWTITTDGNGGGTITPNPLMDPRKDVGSATEDYPGELTKEYDAAIDGLESTLLAMACAGMSVRTPQMRNVIQTTLDAIANNF